MHPLMQKVGGIMGDGSRTSGKVSQGGRATPCHMTLEVYMAYTPGSDGPHEKQNARFDHVSYLQPTLIYITRYGKNITNVPMRKSPRSEVVYFPTTLADVRCS